MTSENGIPQTSLGARLHKVPVAKNTKPDEHQTPDDRLSPQQWEKITRKSGRTKKHALPLRIIGRTSFETLCRVYIGSQFTLSSDCEKLFENSPPHKIIAKIKISVWRTSYSRIHWNDIVDAWDGLKNFTLDLENFSTTIDLTTGHNISGYAEHTPHIYLDAPLALLIHYKGKHVLTISFAIGSKKRLFIRQIQTTTRKGNRWLYKIPGNHMKYIVSQIAKSFPKHKIFLVNGEDLARKILKNYEETIEKIEKIIERKKITSKTSYYHKRIEDALKRKENLLSETHRLAELYNTAVTPKHAGRTVLSNAMRHTEILIERESQ